MGFMNSSVSDTIDSSTVFSADTATITSHTTASSSSFRSPQSTFKNALKSIDVPPILCEGVHVLWVYANGKTRKSFLTLSEDKFTLYITSTKYNNNNGSGSSGKNSISNFFKRKTTSAASSGAGSDLERAIDIGAIHRIQRGSATKKFELARKHRQDSSKSLLLVPSPSKRSNDYDDTELSLRPEQCFSIIFRGDWTLDLMMTNDDTIERDTIVDALDRIIQAYQEHKLKVSDDVLLLRYIWLDADKDKTNTINANEVGRVLDRINFHMKKSQLNEMYEKFAKMIGLDRKMRRQGLTFEQCCTLLHKIKRDTWMVKPVNQVWDTLFGAFMKNGKPRLTVSDKTFLEKFLHKKQRETNATLDDVRKLFARLNELELPHLAADVVEAKDPTRIDKNRFEAYLLGRDNDAFDPSRERFNQRLMKRPISEYWINSSHNTYLTGDQFTSNSRVEMYLNALYRGCRCLELDIWDSGEIDERSNPIPVVWHGHTMTTKILFKDIIKAIKLFLNFHPDTFPIVLSFENHCSIPYQDVMADQLVRILGDALYIPPDYSLSGKLPSPWDMRGMVVIKGRRPDVDDDDTDYDSDDDAMQSMSQSMSVSDETKSSYQSQQSTKRYGVSPQLARLTLFHGSKLKNFEQSSESPTHHMHSFSETKVRSLCRKNQSRNWTKYNQTHMSRTYPAGSRVDSSNYLPMLPWSVGCQLVALNFQTADSALRLNDGRFRENGGCGYVLKPSALMAKNDQASFGADDDEDDDEDDDSVPLKIWIRVMSGSCLPKPKEKKEGEYIDPYVKVSMFDVKNQEKETSTSVCTAAVYHNGFFPIWNEEKFSFTVENWAVAMLQLTVYDKVDVGADHFVASASIPTYCLREGIRSVKLFDSTNTTSGAFDFASLLIDVKIEKAMAEI